MNSPQPPTITSRAADVAYSGRFDIVEKLRKEGVSFLNTVASAPLTPISHATVLTGLQPHNHGIRHLFREQLPNSIPTLGEILKSEGYSTGAFVSCPGMNRWYNFNRGFDVYDDEIPLLADGSDPLETVDVEKRGTALKRANIVVDRAITWLDNHQDEKFFLFVHFFDAHWPYEAPEVFAGDNPYEHEVAFSLHHLGRLIEDLKRRGLYEDLTIVCFSDHGEDLNGWYENDKGGAALGNPEEKGHGCLLYNQTIKVLFVLKDTKLPRDKNIDAQVRLVDVTPTILDLLDIKSNLKLDGESVVPLVFEKDPKSRIAYSETFYPEEQTLATGQFAHAQNKKAVIFDNRYKVISHLGGDYQVQHFDLILDPMEKSNSRN
jgi:arylsulfatase